MLVEQTLLNVGPYLRIEWRVAVRSQPVMLTIVWMVEALVAHMSPAVTFYDDGTGDDKDYKGGDGHYPHHHLDHVIVL